MSINRGIRLVVLDVDGTTLTSSQQVSPGTMQVLRELSQAGVEIILASARSPQMMMSTLATLGCCRYAVAFSGAWIGRVDPGSGVPLQVVHRQPMSPDVALRVVHLAMEAELSVGWLTETTWYTHQLDEAIQHEALLNGANPVVVGLDIHDPVFKVQVLADSPQEAEDFNFLQMKLPPECVGRSSHAVSLEVTHQAADKAMALVKLRDVLGIELSEMAAFGDGENDIGMLQTAGIGIAMGNASVTVQEAADFVTTSNDQDGISVAIARLRQQGRIR